MSGAEDAEERADDEKPASAGGAASAAVGAGVGADDGTAPAAVGVDVGAGASDTGRSAGAAVTVTATAGTAVSAMAGKAMPPAIARAAAARIMGWNVGVFTPQPYLPSLARMAESSPGVTPWRFR